MLSRSPFEILIFAPQAFFAQKLQYAIKNTVTVDKPVSRLLYGNQIEEGFRKDSIALMENDLPASVFRFPGGCWASFYYSRDGMEIHTSDLLFTIISMGLINLIHYGLAQY